MIVFVDLEHARQREDEQAGLRSLGRRLMVKYRLEVLSGHDCLIVNYDRVTPDLLRQHKPVALFVSGNQTDLIEYDEGDLRGLRSIYRSGEWPTFSFCGGFQLLSQTFGSDVGPIGSIGEIGETDTESSDRSPFSGFINEFGFCAVELKFGEPLFAGLGSEVVVHQEHYWEVKTVPDGFRSIATSTVCSLQAIAHGALPLFGTQFHPEYYDDQHRFGRSMIRNFLRLFQVI